MAMLSRRKFLSASSKIGLLALLPPIAPPRTQFRLFDRAYKPTPDLFVAKTGAPAELVRRVVRGLGGMEKFVRKEDVVVLKPNMSWDRTPAQGANTNPEVVAEVVRLCLKAGAKKVRVFDRTCNEARRSYEHSGIAEAAKKAGADVYYVYKRNYVRVKIPNGERLHSWKINKDVLNADVLINLPTAKNHSISKITLGIKNLMGYLGDDRGKIHRHFSQKIVDIASILRPQLTILDATRLLLRNGPQGGNLDDVRWIYTVVGGTDMVAVDAYGASLFGLDPETLGFLEEAYKRGLGEIDLKKIRIHKV
ncbi:hypothetical protein BMS3Abin05_00953 [bacterium BMS3Abin05]|nr:hypothetical protein BMS3Abin05_00953 [bacterium BMS3Abin05]